MPMPKKAGTGIEELKTRTPIMDTGKQPFEIKAGHKSVHYNDPLVIGAGCLALGVVIGSGRLNWLARETGRLAGSLGTLTLNYLAYAFQDRNPQLFPRRTRITH